MAKLILSLVALINGGFMLADGIHVLQNGKYIGPPTPGPWAELFYLADINVFQLGPLFILYGVLWLVLFFGYLFSRRWVYAYGIILAVLTLWYLPFGSVISLITIILLVRSRKRIKSWG